MSLSFLYWGQSASISIMAFITAIFNAISTVSLDATLAYVPVAGIHLVPLVGNGLSRQSL